MNKGFHAAAWKRLRLAADTDPGNPSRQFWAGFPALRTAPGGASAFAHPRGFSPSTPSSLFSKMSVRKLPCTKKSLTVRTHTCAAFLAGGPAGGSPEAGRWAGRLGDALRPELGRAEQAAAGGGEVLRHLADDSLSNKRKAITEVLYHPLGPAHSSLRSLL